MRCIVSTGLLCCGLAVASLSPALAAETCATASGSVPDGTTAVDSCVNAANIVCPGRGPVFECRNGRWYCMHHTNRGSSPPPCTADKAGPWIWTSGQGLHPATN
jgi:hypothetical protein